MKAWIARDKDGLIFIYFDMPPFKSLVAWKTIDEYSKPLDSNLFPEVKWEDEEPTEVEVIVKPKGGAR